MQPTKMISSPSFLQNGGECGEMIKSIDWSDNPLGNPDNWPQSLKSVVSIVLRSACPMFVCWGADLITVYNDAYLPLTGSPFPQFIGLPAYKVWSETWQDSLLAVTNLVVDKGESIYQEDVMILLKRKNFPEETYFNLSYSPIIDEHGHVGGLFCTCQEDTAKVLRHRRLQTLTALYRTISIQKGVEAICHSSIDALKENQFDIPFAAFYLIEEESRKWNLINSTGVAAGSLAKKINTGAGNDDEFWQFRSDLDAGHPVLIDGAGKKISDTAPFITGNLPGKAWVIPLGAAARSKGVIIFGLSARLAFDEEYQLFLRSIVSQIESVLNEHLKEENVYNGVRVFMDMADAIPAMVWMTQPNGDCIYLNELWCSYTGLGKEEALERGWLSPVHPDDRENSNRVFQDANSKQKPFNLVYRLKDKNGGYNWFIDSGKPRFDAAGRYEGFIGSVINIDEQKAFEESTARLAAIVQSSDDAIISKTLEGIITSWNPAAERLFGYSRDEMIGQSINRLIPINRIREEVEIIERMKRGERVEHFETLRLHKTGKTIDISLTISPIRDIKGRITGASKIVREITEQKKLTKAIEESENRLNIAIDSAELGTWELNLKTRNASYSLRYLKIMGFAEDASPSHEELLKRIHPEDRPLREAAITDALRTGLLDMEIRVIHEDYSVHWIKARGKVFYDNNDRSERMLGTVMDITEQEKTILYLQESEERFRTIANSAPVMIWMSGNDRFSDFFNTSWLGFTGRKIEQEIGDGWLEAVHPDDVKKCIMIYRASLDEQKAFYIEYRLRHHSGQYRWISDNAVPRYGSDGKFVGFISACMDIDDQKKSIDRVMESELLFKTITNVSPVALWMTDRTGLNTYVNDTWVEWTSLSNEKREVEGRNWINPVLEEDKELIIKKFMQAYAGRNNFMAEFRIKKVDGTVRWVLSEGSPYYDIDGFFAGYAGSVLDITERKQDEIRKNEFLAVASHELKTPLTSIKAYAQLLEKTYERGEDVFLKTALGKVSNQVNKMTKLVGDFLNLSKIESGKFRLNRETFDICELVQEVAAEIQLVSVSHEIVVETSQPAPIYADREKLAQVVINLLNNSVKYSPENKIVKIKVERENAGIKVSVTDKGIGVKKEEHDKIFQRFYRSEFNDNISFSGFGIGLYISAEIIKSHLGEIGVRSTEGQGATFYFTVPVGEQ